MPTTTKTKVVVATPKPPAMSEAPAVPDAAALHRELLVTLARLVDEIQKQADAYVAANRAKPDDALAAQGLLLVSRARAVYSDAAYKLAKPETELKQVRR